MQHQRYVVLVFVACAVVAGLSCEAATTSAFEQFGLVDTRFLGAVNLTSVISVLLAAGTFFGLLRYPAAVTYTDEAVDELTKVTWPSREETIRAATTVVFTTLFVAALIGVYDLIWKNVADLFLFTEG
jgi:preprotein translocase SecE subunit